MKSIEVIADGGFSASMHLRTSNPTPEQRQCVQEGAFATGRESDDYPKSVTKRSRSRGPSFGSFIPGSVLLNSDFWAAFFLRSSKVGME